MREYVIRFKPKLSLSMTAILSFFALTIPIFTVLYWYTAGINGWGWVAAVNITIALLGILILIRQSMVFTGITGDKLVGNGIFSPTVSIPLSSIRRVVFVRLYSRYSSDTSLQFIALDESGRCVFRMRGAFWHERQLRELADALGVGAPTDTQPVSHAEFFHAFPGSRYWFERKR